MGCQSSKNTGGKKKMNPIGKHIDFIRTGNLNALKKLENCILFAFNLQYNGNCDQMAKYIQLKSTCNPLAIAMKTAEC